MNSGQRGSILWHVHRLVDTAASRLVADRELLERFVHQHDEAAFELLMYRHAPMVRGVCRRVLRDVHAAEDALQATFLTLVRKAASIGKQEALASWLYKVAYRIALRARATQVGSAARVQEWAARQPTAVVPEPGDGAVGRELRQILDEEVNRLPQAYRAPVVLCLLEGKTHQQAADELGWPKGTVSTRLLRACARLRHRLTRRGLTLSAVGLAAIARDEAAAGSVSLGPTLVDAVLRAGAQMMPAGPISARAIALAQEAVRALFLARLKIVTVAALAAMAVGLGAGLLALPPKLVQPDPALEAKQHAPVRSAAPRAEAITWHEQGRLRGHAGPPTLVFSPDGQTLAILGQEGTLRLWNATEGRDVGVIALAESYRVIAAQAVWSPDSRFVAVVGAKPIDGCWVPEVLLLDRATAQPAGVLPGHDPVFAPRDGILATWVNGVVKLWDYPGRKERATLRPGKGRTFRPVHFSPNGEIVATTHGDATVTLWDVTTGTQCASLAGGAPAFSPDGALLAVAQPDGTVALWDAARRAKGRTLGKPGPVCLGLQFSPDGRTLVVARAVMGADRRRWRVQVWDVATGKRRGTVPGPAVAVSSVFFSRDGRTLGYRRRAGKENTALVLWDVVEWREKQRLAPVSTVDRWEVYHAVADILVSEAANGGRRLCEATMGRELASFPEDWSAIAFSPDGRTMAAVVCRGSTPKGLLTTPWAEKAWRWAGANLGGVRPQPWKVFRDASQSFDKRPAEVTVWQRGAPPEARGGVGTP